MGGVLKGIVTSRDVDFLEDDSLSRPLSDVRWEGGREGGRVGGRDRVIQVNESNQCTPQKQQL